MRSSLLHPETEQTGPLPPDEDSTGVPPQPAIWLWTKLCWPGGTATRGCDSRTALAPPRAVISPPLPARVNNSQGCQIYVTCVAALKETKALFWGAGGDVGNQLKLNIGRGGGRERGRRMAEIRQATSSNNNWLLIIQEQSLDYSAISEVRGAGTVRVDNVIGAHFGFQ